MPLIGKPPVEDDEEETAAPVEEKPPGKPVLSDNSVLKAAEEKIEANLTDEIKPIYSKIVVAGLKAGMEGGETSILAKLKDSEDPVADAGKGAAGLVAILRKNSRNTMPLHAMIPAGATLMLQALDFLQKAGIADIGTEEITKASKEYTNVIFKVLGVTPQMLVKGNEAVSNLTKDPAVMEQMKRKAGLVKAPGTSSPTEVPEEEPDAV